MLNEVEQFIRRWHLLDKSALHVVALSGGADSTAMLLVLKSLGYKVEAAHCNFRLRGAESDRDERFCRDLCAAEGIPFHIVHFDTREYASLHKLSIETAARQLRYNWFEQLRHDIGAADICVAHHKDDNAETVLMHLIRGTGIIGLCGIRPKNGRIVRPLLCVSREQIKEFLASVHQDYVDDSTNFIPDATRNKFRLQVIPLLKAINPAAVDNINSLSQTMLEVEKVVESAMPKSDRLEDIRRCASLEMAVYYLLMDKGFSREQINDIAVHISDASGKGKLWYSSGYMACIGSERLEVVSKDELDINDMKLPEPGTYCFGSNRIRLSLEEWVADNTVPRGSMEVAVDAHSVMFPLTLRRYREGERFVPFGMNGSKLLSDFLTDNHCSAIDRLRQLVLADADGNIIWVVGRRIDNRVRVSDKTKEVLKISFA